MIDMTPGTKHRQALDAYVEKKNKLYNGRFFTPGFMDQQVQTAVSNMIKTYNKRQTIPTINAEHVFVSHVLFLAKDIMDYAIYSRYINGNVADLLNGVHTYGRLIYLANLVAPFTKTESNTMHSIEMLTLAVAYDKQLLYAETGDLFNPNMLFGLRAIDTADAHTQKQAAGKIDAALDMQKKGMYVNEYSCIRAIISQDRELLTRSIIEILNTFRRSYISQGLFEHVCLPAHGLFNIAYSAFERAGNNPPAEPAHEYWDTQFWHHLRAVGEQREYIANFHHVSPVLAEWMDELPDSIDLNRLYTSA